MQAQVVAAASVRGHIVPQLRLLSANVKHLVPRARPGPLDHVQYKPWPETALPRYAGVVTFRLRGGLPRGVAVLGDRRLGLSGIEIPHRCPLSVNQNWQQVETAADWIQLQLAWPEAALPRCAGVCLLLSCIAHLSEGIRAGRQTGRLSLCRD